MLEYEIFNKKTLNIFCDASKSSIKDAFGGTIAMGCPGAIAVITTPTGGYEIIDKSLSIEYCATNNNSEMKALLLGVKLAVKYKDKFNFINIFSDSKISIFGLREWIFKNWTYADNTIYSSSGEPVKNQDIIFYIIETLLKNDLRVSFYYQKGHAVGKGNLAKAKFCEGNFIKYAEDTLIQTITHFNDVIDNLTRDYLKENLYNEKLYNFNFAIYPNVNVRDLDRYKTLILGEI